LRPMEFARPASPWAPGGIPGRPPPPCPTPPRPCRQAPGPPVSGIHGGGGGLWNFIAHAVAFCLNATPISDPDFRTFRQADPEVGKHPGPYTSGTAERGGGRLKTLQDKRARLLFTHLQTSIKIRIAESRKCCHLSWVAFGLGFRPDRNLVPELGDGRTTVSAPRPTMVAITYGHLIGITSQRDAHTGRGG